jgi:hypothetical protein
VNDRSEHGESMIDVATDLVEYFVVVVPELDSLSTLVPALADMAKRGSIRILDLVVVTRAPDGTAEVMEFEAVASLTALWEVEGQVGGLLSERDIAMASVAVKPGAAGIVVVTEDRWAEPLSSAARRAGGQIVGGERVAPSRVEAALTTGPDDAERGSGHGPAEPFA